MPLISTGTHYSQCVMRTMLCTIFDFPFFSNSNAVTIKLNWICLNVSTEVTSSLFSKFTGNKWSQIMFLLSFALKQRSVFTDFLWKAQVGWVAD